MQLPYAPNARSNPTAQPWGFQGRKDAFGVLRLEMDITDNVTLYASAGAHDFRMGGLYSAATTITNFNGAGTALAPLNFSQYTTSLTAQGGLRAPVQYGAGQSRARASRRRRSSRTTARPTSRSRAAPSLTNIYNSTSSRGRTSRRRPANKTSSSGFNEHRHRRHDLLAEQPGPAHRRPARAERPVHQLQRRHGRGDGQLRPDRRSAPPWRSS